MTKCKRLLMSLSPNIFDGVLEIGGYANATGAPVSLSDRIRNKNQFIPVQPSTDYVVDFVGNTNKSYNMFFYNNNKEFIVRNAVLVGNSVTSPDTAAYINFVIGDFTNTSIKLQIEPGTKPTLYEPYGG